MTILTRVTGKVFGSEAPADEIGVFGSAKDGHPTNSSDVATIQSYSNDAYLKGWGSGIVSAQNFPPMEEVTGVLKTISYQTCYALQSGIPIYDAGTEYGTGDIVKVPNGVQLDFYIAQRDATTHDHTPNINKWGDPLFWQKAIIVGDREIGIPQISLQMTGDLPAGYIDLNGATVSRTDYNNLFAIYGTAYGAGDGSTTFKLPDFRNRYICGVDNNLASGYVSAGLPNLGLATTSAGAHTHKRGTMNITATGGMWEHDKRNNFTGAFYLSKNSGKYGSAGDLDKDNYTMDFDASRSWKGETTSNGAHTHTITSSSSLYGTTSTIKTDGIKVRVYTRYE